MALCQFLCKGWKVIFAIKQHSQPLFTVRKKGGRVILQKNTQAKAERSKKGKKSIFLTNSKIPDCGPTSAARELKRE
jgi:uncharacterized protein with PIN domain